MVTRTRGKGTRNSELQGCKGTPYTQLRSDPTTDQILLRNIWTYLHCSKHTLLPPNALSLFGPWLPDAGMRGHCNIYNVDYSPQEPHLIL